MPRDLIAELKLKSSEKSGSKRDLLAEYNLKPKKETKSSALREALAGINENPAGYFAPESQYGPNINAPLNMLAGLSKAGTNVGNTINELIGNPVKNIFGRKPARPSNMNNELGIDRPNEALQGIAGYLPFGAVGGPSILGQVLAGYGHGFSQADPNQENLLLPPGRQNAGLEGAGLNATIGSMFKGANILRPSTMTKGNIPMEELAANAEAAKGSSTGLGQVTGNPLLQKFHENILSYMPGSGASEKMAQEAINLQVKGDEIMKRLLGEATPTNYKESIKEGLHEAHQIAKKFKDEPYQSWHAQSINDNIAYDLPSLTKAPKKYAKALEKSNITTLDTNEKAVIKKIQDYLKPAINPATGEKTYPATLTSHDLSTLKANVYSMAKEYKGSSELKDRKTAKILMGMYGKIKGDIVKKLESHAANTGNAKPLEDFLAAEKNYKENYAPYLDKGIYKFSEGGEDTDLIVQSFLKGGKSDRQNLLSKIFTKLPKEQQDQFVYGYLSPATKTANNKINPSIMGNLINSQQLGQGQRDVLLNDKALKKELEQFARMAKMNEKGSYQMMNPETGAFKKAETPLKLIGLGATGAQFAGPLGALGLPVATMVASRLLNNYITSPTVREKIVKAIIENKPWGKSAPAIETGIRGKRKEEK